MRKRIIVYLISAITLIAVLLLFRGVTDAPVGKIFWSFLGILALGALVVWGVVITLSKPNPGKKFLKIAGTLVVIGALVWSGSWASEKYRSRALDSDTTSDIAEESIPMVKSIPKHQKTASNDTTFVVVVYKDSVVNILLPRPYRLERWAEEKEIRVVERYVDATNKVVSIETVPGVDSSVVIFRRFSCEKFTCGPIVLAK